MVKNLGLFLILTLLYLILGKICLALALPPGYSAPIWLPTGVMVTSLFFASLEIVVPATLLGSFFVNFALTHSLHPSLWDSLAMSGTTALGSVACVAMSWPFMRLFKIWRRRPGRDEKKILLLLLALGPFCALFSSLCGVFDLLYFGVIEREYFLTNWAHWWVGDSIGILLMLPIGYVLLFPRQKIPWRRGLGLLFPLVIVLLGLTLIFSYSDRTEVQALQDSFSHSADRLTREVNDGLKLDIELMTSLRSFYEGSSVVEEHEFHEFLSGSFKNHPDLEQIIWIPSRESPLYLSFYSHSDADPHFEPLFVKDKIWRKVKDTRVPVVGPQIQNMQLLIFPVSKKNVPLGMLVGVVNTEKMISSAAQRAEMHGYEIQLIDQNTKIANYWRNGNLSEMEKLTREGAIRHNYDFQVLDHVWSLEITTTRSQLLNAAPGPTLLLLFFGLIFVYLICSLQLLLYFRSENAEKETP